mgnify:CR=1 FL=1
MKLKAQIESLIYFIVIIILFFSAIFYYLQFKTGSVPVFRPKREIAPSEKSILPPGTFFEKENKKNNKEKNFFPLLFIKETFARNNNLKKNLIPNKDLETIILSPSFFTELEDNKLYILLEGYNKNDKKDRIHFQYILEPLINDWKDLYQKRKLIILPKGSNVYTLKVRSINNKNEYDPTPAISYIYTKISPYYKDLDVSVSYSRDILIIKNRSNKDINVTDWRIKTSQIAFKIPKAVKNFNLFSTQTLEDIVLKSKRGRLIIHNQKLPFDLNFLTNKCFVYLSQNFPDIYKFVKKYTFFKCQKLTREEIFNLRNKLNIRCLEVLEKIGCEGPKAKEWLKIENNPSCLNFFDKNFTYIGCYENKINDKDFYMNDWYVYFDKNLKFTKDRYEEIIIYDNKGLLVNKKTIY